MKIIEPYAKIVALGGYATGIDMLRMMERCARLCYRSEDAQTEDSYKRLLPSLLNNGHMSIFEHGSITVEFCVDRGLQQEITRHRLFSYSAESTRYVAYDRKKHSGEIKVIRPNGLSEDQEINWRRGVRESERAYLDLRRQDVDAQIARDVLPLCLASVFEMTGNPRAFRHFLLQRTAKNVHPKLLDVTLPLLESFKLAVPILYDDIQPLADPKENAKLVQ
jgi:thymidylate synthase (FAD)